MKKIKQSFSITWLDRCAIILAFVLLGIGFVQVHNQNISLKNQIKHESIIKNENREAFIESRYRDCQRENNLREALKVNVENSQKDIPLLLKLLPQLNSKEVLTINKKSVEYQLERFSPLNCVEYANEVVHKK